MNTNHAAYSSGNRDPVSGASQKPGSDGRSRSDASPLASTSVVLDPASNEALKIELYKRFHPARSACRDFSLSDDAFAPKEPNIPSPLAEVLKDPSNRSCAWRSIGTLGAAAAFSKTERRALYSGLLCYVREDRDECVIPLIEIANYASEERDMQLYKAVGEVVRAAGLGNDISSSAISAFCKLECYNATREPYFSPWMEIFGASQSIPVYQQMTTALAARVSAKEHGTYDHLLRALCHADSSRAAALLRTLVVAPLPPRAEEIPRPDSLKIGLSVFIPSTLGAIMTQGVISGISAILQAEPVLSAVTTGLLSPGAWAIGGFFGVIGGLSLASFARQESEYFAFVGETTRKFMQSSDFRYFAERVYARLGEAGPTNRFAKILRADMESCEVYASVVERWRGMHPLHCIGNEERPSAKG